MQTIIRRDFKHGSINLSEKRFVNKKTCRLSLERLFCNTCRDSSAASLERGDGQ